MYPDDESIRRPDTNWPGPAPILWPVVIVWPQYWPEHSALCCTVHCVALYSVVHCTLCTPPSLLATWRLLMAPSPPHFHPLHTLLPIPHRYTGPIVLLVYHQFLTPIPIASPLTNNHKHQIQTKDLRIFHLRLSKYLRQL